MFFCSVHPPVDICLSVKNPDINVRLAVRIVSLCTAIYIILYCSVLCTIRVQQMYLFLLYTILNKESCVLPTVAERRNKYMVT